MLTVTLLKLTPLLEDKKSFEHNGANQLIVTLNKKSKPVYPLLKL
jgi:hypothetical protein